jgi:hypothetical protein
VKKKIVGAEKKLEGFSKDEERRKNGEASPTIRQTIIINNSTN